MMIVDDQFRPVAFSNYATNILDCTGEVCFVNDETHEIRWRTIDKHYGGILSHYPVSRVLDDWPLNVRCMDEFRAFVFDDC